MLYRFQIELSDVDRGIYEALDFRVAKHPSETAPYLLTRILAYALSFQSNLEFTSGGLHDPEAPALRAIGNNGTIDLWIEVGNPSARKLHKANKTAKQVLIYTYKSAEVLVADIIANDVHKASQIQIFSFEPQFLQKLEAIIVKNNRWSVLFQDGQMTLHCEGQTLTTEVKKSKVEV